MQYLIYFYPAIISLIGCYFYNCYGRYSKLIVKFGNLMMHKVAMRKLYISSLQILMLIFNFWYFQVFGVNTMFCIASVLCATLFSFRTAEHIILGIKSQAGTVIAFISMLSCVVIPQIWPLAMCLYILMVGSMFYPQKNLIRIMTFFCSINDLMNRFGNCSKQDKTSH